MGLTIHYQGRIKELRRIPELTAEVADICESLRWPYHLHDEVETVSAKTLSSEPGTGDPQKIGLRGILFTPPACETVVLVFGNSGRLINLLSLQFAGDGNYPPEYIYMLHTKTQRAGADMHVALVTLLKYLEKKYALGLEVHDEGNYWNTLDRTVLNIHFEAYDSMIDMVATALRNDQGPGPLDDRAASVADWVERVLRERMGGEQKGEEN